MLRDASWADYQRVLEMRCDRSVPRISYLEGTLQLLTPSRHHESIKSRVGRLVSLALQGYPVPLPKQRRPR